MSTIKVSKETLNELVKLAWQKIGRLEIGRPIKPVRKNAEAALGRNPGVETIRCVYSKKEKQFSFQCKEIEFSSSFPFSELQTYIDALCAGHPEYDRESIRVCTGHHEGRYSWEGCAGHYLTIEIKSKISDIEWGFRVVGRQQEFDRIFAEETQACETQVAAYKKARQNLAEKTQKHLGELMPAIAEELRATLEMRQATNPMVEVRWDAEQLFYYLEISSDDDRHVLGKQIPGIKSRSANFVWSRFQIRLARDNGRKSGTPLPSDVVKGENDWEKDLEIV